MDNASEPIQEYLYMKKKTVKRIVIFLVIVLILSLIPFGVARPAGMTTYHALAYEVDDYYAAIEDTDYQTGIVIRILGHEVYRNLTVDESAKP